MHNKINLSNLRVILHALDKDSDLYASQMEVCALVEQLENNSYTLYSEDFSDSTWQHECNLLGVPHESKEVAMGVLVKRVKLETCGIAKHFCLDHTMVRSENGLVLYSHPDKGMNDIQIAHIEGNKVVYDINPVFQIGETFTLPYEQYEEDNVTHKTITETYTITGYDLSGCHADDIVYLGDNGSAWISEDALVEQKAKFKIGDTFEIHFDYYEEGELTSHTITRIDFSKTESSEVLYCDDDTQVYITESELVKYKKASSYFVILDENQYRVVSGRYYAGDDDVERISSDSDACYTGTGKFLIEDVGSYYKDRGFDAEFLARSAFCVRAVPIGKESVAFLVHTNTLDSIMKDEITTTQQLEYLVSEERDMMATNFEPKANNEYLGRICIPSDIVALFGAHPVMQIAIEFENGEFSLESEHIALADRQDLWFSINQERSWQFPEDAPDFAYWQCRADGKYYTLPKNWVKLVLEDGSDHSVYPA